MKIVLVAAVAKNGVIGRDNGLPWRIKSDLQYFRSL
ncbi:MAG: dihydrofolate reductase, partial [Pseudorhodoplanes sp.]